MLLGCSFVPFPFTRRLLYRTFYVKGLTLYRFLPDVVLLYRLRAGRFLSALFYRLRAGTVYVPDVLLYRLRAGCYNVPLTCRMLLGCSSFVPFTCQMSSSTGSAPDVILLYRLRAGRYDVTLLVHPAGLSKNEGAAGTPPRGRLQSGRPLLVSGEARAVLDRSPKPLLKGSPGGSVPAEARAKPPP